MTDAQRIVQLEAKVAQLKTTIQKLEITLRSKNKELDALSYVWCSGGCDDGMYRYTGLGGAALTEEIVLKAERNTARLRTYFSNFACKRRNALKRHAEGIKALDY